jgi:hypothetical protein
MWSPFLSTPANKNSDRRIPQSWRGRRNSADAVNLRNSLIAVSAENAVMENEMDWALAYVKRRKKPMTTGKYLELPTEATP